MLNKKALKYAEHVDRDLAADAGALVEGAIAVEVMEEGKAKIKVKATAAGSDVVAGILMLPYELPAQAPAKEQYTVKADALIVKLRNEKLISGSVLVKVAGVALALVDFTTGPADDTEVGVDLVNGKLKFHSGHATKVAEVVYTHELTVEQAKTRYHERFITNRDAVASLRKASVLKGYVEVMTSHYDTNIDWSAGGVLKLGADGKVTIGGSGPAIPNAKILAIPAATNSAQGAFLHFSALIP